MTVYRIVKWTEIFETADSRRYSRLHWFSVPNGFDSNGYASMVIEFGDEAPAIYGAWIALANIASTCPIRGILSTSSGAPLTAARLAFLSRFPSTVFDRLIQWASSESVGWLEVMVQEELEKLLNRLPPDHQTGDKRLPNGLLDQTEPDRTEPNPTRPNQTGPNQSSPSRRSVVDVMAGFDSDVATRLANKLLRHHESSLGAELIWQLACVAQLFDESIVTDLVGTLKRDAIRSPSRYARAVIRKACDERTVDHQELLRNLPETPAKKSPAMR